MNKIDGQNLWNQFDQGLTPYAQKNADSQGRSFPEPTDPNRLPFQRDRDRIIHTTSFRRLKGKMQVVTPAYGDHFRNRLSHSLEVAQIARDLARHLRLNEDLVEAIALAHDLGHPPFGHTGESALNEKMKMFGSAFDHNKQSLRVVTHFERRYQKFPGLNLSQEVIEGLQKHETFFDRPSGTGIYSPHLEAQIVDIADEIAYLSADLEDALRGGFITISSLNELTITTKAMETLPEEEKKDRSAIIRRTIRILLQQIIQDSLDNIDKYQIKTLSDVQKQSHRIIYFNSHFYKEFRALKQFLFQHFYLSPAVKRMTDDGANMIKTVFDTLYQNPQQIPTKFLPAENPAQRVCDYIAGMTDDFLVALCKKNNKA